MANVKEISGQSVRLWFNNSKHSQWRLRLPLLLSYVSSLLSFVYHTRSCCCHCADLNAKYACLVAKRLSIQSHRRHRFILMFQFMICFFTHFIIHFDFIRTFIGMQLYVQNIDLLVDSQKMRIPGGRRGKEEEKKPQQMCFGLTIVIKTHNNSIK